MRRLLFLAVAVGTLSVGPWRSGIAHADSLGQAYQFRVNTAYDALGAATISSTLRAAGARGYFYVDDRYWDTLTVQQQQQYTFLLQQLSDEFDGTIYPRSVSLWGSEATPGVDGDPHVVILLEKLAAGSGGYFETIHNYSKERAPLSNAREMIFVSAESVPSGAARIYIAHEFQHLISFQQRELLLDAEDDVWLNEARSEYNVTAVGYSTPYEGSTLQRRAQSFVRTPSDSLTEWPNTATDYAIASLFAHYVVDRFGSTPLVHAIHSVTAGTAVLDEWLSSEERVHIGDVFADWMTAVVLEDRSISPAYGYTLAGLSGVRVTPAFAGQLSTMTSMITPTITLKEWQPSWTSFAVASGLGIIQQATVTVSGASDATWRGSVLAAYHGGEVRVIPYVSNAGIAQVHVPLRASGSELAALTVTTNHGRSESLLGRSVMERSATITASLGDVAVIPAPPSSQKPVDGDLIRRPGQSEVYVVWGPYRRYLTNDTLALYGFQSRLVREIDDDMFFSYATSNYIRSIGTEKVYAVWPDGTKHWLHITAAQWDASGRDWGAIFTVNDAEVAQYVTGPDITR